MPATLDLLAMLPINIVQNDQYRAKANRNLEVGGKEQGETHSRQQG